MKPELSHHYLHLTWEQAKELYQFICDFTSCPPVDHRNIGTQIKATRGEPCTVVESTPVPRTRNSRDLRIKPNVITSSLYSIYLSHTAPLLKLSHSNPIPQRRTHQLRPHRRSALNIQRRRAIIGEEPDPHRLFGGVESRRDGRALVDEDFEHGVVAPGADA
jgi:hypothetical protein